MVATAKPAGSLLFQLVQKLPGSLHSKNIQAFGAIIYAMCFSVFTTYWQIIYSDMLNYILKVPQTVHCETPL